MQSREPAYRADDSTRATLFAEAERQLNICNSCRYCEGYCAVFPALERRTLLDRGDVSFLANLCHDCRACLYACMYAPPHEFGVNPPAILAEVRRQSYEAFTPAFYLRRLADRGERTFNTLAAGALSVVAVVGFVAADHGFSSLYRATEPSGSPYAVMTYAAIVAASSVASVLALVAMAAGALSWWRSIGRRPGELARLSAWARALRYGATLRYLRGGAEGCYVSGERPDAKRRVLHYLVSYGFLLCLVSTIAAGVEGDLLGLAPPYPFSSVPVLCGLIGGIGLVLGSIGLLRLRSDDDALAVDGHMRRMDQAFILMLFALGASGLVVLLTRNMADYGTILAVHLAIVWSAILLAPTAKFVHFLYRLLAIVADEIESDNAG